MNVSKNSKDLRRLSNRLATVMFHGTPCRRRCILNIRRTHMGYAYAVVICYTSITTSDFLLLKVEISIVGFL